MDESKALDVLIIFAGIAFGFGCWIVSINYQESWGNVLGKVLPTFLVVGLVVVNGYLGLIYWMFFGALMSKAIFGVG